MIELLEKISNICFIGAGIVLLIGIISIAEMVIRDKKHASK